MKMGVSVIVTGVPHDIPLRALVIELNEILDDQDIGDFCLRDVEDESNKDHRKVALDFESSLDAKTAQEKLNSHKLRHINGIYTLNTSVEATSNKLVPTSEYVISKTSKENNYKTQLENMSTSLDEKYAFYKKQALVLKAQRKFLKEQNKLRKELKRLGSDTDEETSKTGNTRKRIRHSPNSISSEDTIFRPISKSRRYEHYPNIESNSISTTRSKSPEDLEQRTAEDYNKISKYRSVDKYCARECRISPTYRKSPSYRKSPTYRDSSFDRTRHRRHERSRSRSRDLETYRRRSQSREKYYSIETIEYKKATLTEAHSTRYNSKEECVLKSKVIMPNRSRPRNNNDFREKIYGYRRQSSPTYLTEFKNSDSHSEFYTPRSPSPEYRSHDMESVKKQAMEDILFEMENLLSQDNNIISQSVFNIVVKDIVRSRFQKLEVHDAMMVGDLVARYRSQYSKDDDKALLNGLAGESRDLDKASTMPADSSVDTQKSPDYHIWTAVDEVLDGVDIGMLQGEPEISEVAQMEPQISNPIKAVVANPKNTINQENIETISETHRNISSSSKGDNTVPEKLPQTISKRPLLNNPPSGKSASNCINTNPLIYPNPKKSSIKKVSNSSTLLNFTARCQATAQLAKEMMAANRDIVPTNVTLKTLKIYVRQRIEAILAEKPGDRLQDIIVKYRDKFPLGQDREFCTGLMSRTGVCQMKKVGLAVQTKKSKHPDGSMHQVLSPMQKAYNKQNQLQGDSKTTQVPPKSLSRDPGAANPKNASINSTVIKSKQENNSKTSLEIKADSNKKNNAQSPGIHNIETIEISDDSMDNIDINVTSAKVPEPLATNLLAGQGNEKEKCNNKENQTTDFKHTKIINVRSDLFNTYLETDRKDLRVATHGNVVTNNSIINKQQPNIITKLDPKQGNLSKSIINKQPQVEKYNTKENKINTKKGKQKPVPIIYCRKIMKPLYKLIKKKCNTYKYMREITQKVVCDRLKELVKGQQPPEAHVLVKMYQAVYGCETSIEFLTGIQADMMAGKYDNEIRQLELAERKSISKRSAQQRPQPVHVPYSDMIPENSFHIPLGPNTPPAVVNPSELYLALMLLAMNRNV